MRALHIERYHPVPDLAVFDARPDLYHGAGCRITDYPGRMKRRCRATIDQIPPLKRNGLNGNQNIACSNSGSWKIDVVQNARVAGCIVDCCFHKLSTPHPNQAMDWCVQLASVEAFYRHPIRIKICPDHHIPGSEATVIQIIDLSTLFHLISL